MSICWFNHLWAAYELVMVLDSYSNHEYQKQRRTCKRCNKVEYV